MRDMNDILAQREVQRVVCGGESLSALIVAGKQEPGNHELGVVLLDETIQLSQFTLSQSQLRRVLRQVR